MAGTFTQKRDLSRRISVGGIDYLGIPHYTGYPDSVRPGNQTTTSYRSGGRFDSLAGDRTESQELFIANHDQFVRPYDTGHEFSTVKNFTVLSHPEVFLKGINNSYYRGPITLDGDGSTFKTPPPVNLEVYGTKAIKATRPDKPRAQLATTLIELSREGIPALIGFANSRQGIRPSGPGNVLNKAGSEWLNYKFGIEPLVAAISDLAHAVIDSDAILKQYLRDSSKVVRRRMDFPVIVDTIERSSNGNGVNGFLANPTRWRDSFQMTGNTVRESISTQQRIWFSGAFQYYVPQFSNEPMDELETFRLKAKKLINLELTAEVIYSITPWSWLLDWFFNFGDILANADSFNQDHVLLRYGYMMRETVIHRTLSAPDIAFMGKRLGGVSVTYITISKERIRATPFGFGLNPNAFTPGQWTILAALGMTKGANKLR